jgi:hypothetical protein
MSIRQAVGFHMVIWLSGPQTISPTLYEAAGWQPGQAESVGNDRITVAALRPQDLLEDAFRPIARDGAGTIEVVLRLLHSLEIWRNSILICERQHLMPPRTLPVAHNEPSRRRAICKLCIRPASSL